MHKLNVMLVDDHAVVRMGFKLLLQACDGIAVVAEADSGEAACQLLDAAAPDVVVMDPAMPGMGGMEAIKCLCAKKARVAQISDTLKLPNSTVGTHLYNIKQKLGLNNQAEMTLLAVRYGVINVTY